MPLPYDFLISNGTAVTPSGTMPCDIAIRDGQIAALGDLGTAKAAHKMDASGLHILPGLIDSQVHFREPGNEHKEDLEHGTRAAALGGITTIFEMPNTAPPTTTAEALQDKLDRTQGRTYCDHAFYMGASAENAEALATLERLPGCCGVKAFMGSSTGTLLVPDDDTMMRVLQHGHRRMAVHAEDEPRLNERKPLADGADGDVRAHAEWRDAETARLATERLLRLARAAGRRVHVLHVTTALEPDMLAAAKDFATMEVTPQHLTLSAPECYERLGTLAQMNPPIRSQEHRQALWRAVQDGIVDVIGSDHAPHTAEEKAAPYPNTPSGMPGVQTTLPLMLTHVAQGHLTLERLVDLMAAGPQRVFGLAGKGRIAVGYDADLTLVDLKAERDITREWLAYKCGWSPFEGMRCTGWPVATFLRGHKIMQDGEILGPAIGAPARFVETLYRR